jgi:hypothetical protein
MGEQAAKDYNAQFAELSARTGDGVEEVKNAADTLGFHLRVWPITKLFKGVAFNCSIFKGVAYN